MPARIDVLGQRFGKLVVVGEAPPLNRHRRVRCLCDCGSYAVSRPDSLRKGKTSSCGCNQAEHARRLGYANKKHGKSFTPIHSKWVNIHQRCENTRDPQYPDYGGRGIFVCERWKSFDNFYRDLGDPPPGMSLDRINNDGPYSPENCRWATPSMQNSNKRPSRKRDTKIFGVDRRVWAKALGLRSATVHFRMRRGWSAERALGIYVAGI